MPDGQVTPMGDSDFNPQIQPAGGAPVPPNPVPDPQAGAQAMPEQPVQPMMPQVPEQPAVPLQPTMPQMSAETPVAPSPVVPQAPAQPIVGGDAPPIPETDTVPVTETIPETATTPQPIPETPTDTIQPAPIHEDTSPEIQPPSTTAEIDPNRTKITIVLPSHAYFTAGIREFTFDLVKNMTGFSEQWAFRFQSVIDELCNNAIEHGSKKGADIRITFIAQRNEYMEIFVEDTGTGESPRTPEELTEYVDEKKTQPAGTVMTLRERGLWQIVSNWSDKLDFSKSELGGIKAHIIKYINKEPAPTTPDETQSNQLS